MKSKRELTAPCGLDCFNCELYTENLTEEMRLRFAALAKIPPGQAVCKGCREQQGCRLQYPACATLDCVRQKGVEFCHECRDFPCQHLLPAADRADRLPHNLKVFNLCRIKAMGAERWAAEEAGDIRCRYFKGKLIVGLGPILEK